MYSAFAIAFKITLLSFEKEVANMFNDFFTQMIFFVSNLLIIRLKMPFINMKIILRLTTLLKKSLWHRCFPVNFAKFLKTPFFTEHLRWLLLFITSNVDKCINEGTYMNAFKKTGV